MVYLSLTFLVAAMVAGVFGLGAGSPLALWIAWGAFVTFMTLFIVTLVIPRYQAVV